MYQASGQDRTDAQPNYRNNVDSTSSGRTITQPSGGQKVKVEPGIYEKENYNMKHENRGRALIINNRIFYPGLGMEDRMGSDVDASAIYQRFQELGFDCDLLNDATADQIIQKLKQCADDEDYNKDADCFACCILTHGDANDKLYATDKIMQLEDFLRPFFASNCKKLIQKPKLFFIQACRGKVLSSGQECVDPNVSDAAPDSTEYEVRLAQPQTFRVPDESDFLFMFSSFQGRQAFRNTQRGSPFVMALSEEISKLKDDVDIYTLLTRVNKSFLQYRPSNDMYQIPCFLSTLTKKLEIGPKD